MRKIPSLFVRNYDGDRLVCDEVVPGSEWVVRGEGTATRKLDGTCCLVRGGELFKRYDLKPGKNPPDGFEAAQEPDPKTGKRPGWVPVVDGDPASRWHLEAWERCSPMLDGTYELLGPKVQGDPERIGYHTFMRHGAEPLLDCPRDYEGIRSYLETHDIEGVVWWHPDGRMVKIKGKDFGIKR